MTTNDIVPTAGILLPLVSSCGLLGNAAAILVLRSQGLDMKVKLITDMSQAGYVRHSLSR